jgi:hypothetical protein
MNETREFIENWVGYGTLVIAFTVLICASIGILGFLGHWFWKSVPLILPVTGGLLACGAIWGLVLALVKKLID